MCWYFGLKETHDFFFVSFLWILSHCSMGRVFTACVRVCACVYLQLSEGDYVCPFAIHLWRICLTVFFYFSSLLNPLLFFFYILSSSSFFICFLRLLFPFFLLIPSYSLSCIHYSSPFYLSSSYPHHFSTRISVNIYTDLFSNARVTPFSLILCNTGRRNKQPPFVLPSVVHRFERL